ncbi:MAG: 2Fe-2S iron-sulfur cluster-binding protein, partial [Pseudomonadota bacterium]
VRDLAQANGWPMDQIHFESFGAASTPQDRELTITLAKSGKTLTVPASRSILDALLDTGLAVPHDCKRGECSLCITQVLDGKPEHRDLCLTAEERSHSMCVCVSRAKTQSLTLVL